VGVYLLVKTYPTTPKKSVLYQQPPNILPILPAQCAIRVPRELYYPGTSVVAWKPQKSRCLAPTRELGPFPIFEMRARDQAPTVSRCEALQGTQITAPFSEPPFAGIVVITPHSIDDEIYET